MIPRDYLESLPTDTIDAVDFGDRVSSLFFNLGQWWYRLGNQTFPLIPYKTYRSGLLPVVIGNKVTISHGIPNFNPATSNFLLRTYLQAVASDLGYGVGDVVTVDQGVSVKVSSTELTVFYDSKGVDIISNNNQNTSKSIKAIDWNLFVNLVVYG